MKTENWIERYVHEIGRHLPRKMREDVQQELHTLLQEMVWERLEQTPDEKEEQVALNVLREFGKPEEVALRYRPDRALISPESYPVYVVVLQVILGIQSLFFLAALGYSLFVQQNEAPLATIGSTAAEWVETALLNVGLVTLIFAVIERLEGTRPQKTSPWDPRSLPKLKDPDQINRGELIGGIVFLMIFIIVLNFFPQIIGLIDIAGEEWGIVSLLAPGFYQHIPWITVSALLDIVIKSVVLGRGRWQKSTRLAELGALLFSLFILYRIISGGEILVVSALTVLAKVSIGVVMIIELLDGAGKVYRLFTQRTPSFWPLKVVQQ
jgi:hypothetical protein